MKYKQQLYFVISIIALRVLMFLFYMFFTPDQAGPYTLYSLILYCLFDVLILAYLYHFVKKIKQQAFSLVAVSMVIVAMIINLLINLFSPFDTSGWSQFEIELQTAIPNFISLLANIVLIIQLIRNKSGDLTGKYLKMLGWTYVFVWFVGFGAGAVIDYIPGFPIYLIQVIATFPWVAMIIVYVKELQQNSTKDHSGPAIDSGL